MVDQLSQLLKELRQLRTEIRAPIGKRLLPLDLVALKLGLSKQTIRNALQRKTFPIKPCRFGGSKLLWREQDIDAFIDGLGAAE